MIPSFSHRLGRRGLFLTIHGIAWISYGISVIVDPAFGVKRGLGWIQHIISFHWLAWIWIICGLVAISYAPFRRPGRDALGFTIAGLPPALWSLAYLLGGIAYPRGVFNAVTWIATAATITIVAGMPEPGGRGGDVQGDL